MGGMLATFRMDCIALSIEKVYTFEHSSTYSSIRCLCSVFAAEQAVRITSISIAIIMIVIIEGQTLAYYIAPKSIGFSMGGGKWLRLCWSTLNAQAINHEIIIGTIGW